MRNELQRHKRSDKVKWVLTGIMFFLAFVMIAGLILQVFGTGKAKPSEWFKKQDSEQTEQLPAEGGKNATAHARVKAMAATLSTDEETDGTVNNDSGISSQVDIAIDSLHQYSIVYTVPVEFNCRVINNVHPGEVSGAGGLFYSCKKDSSGNMGLVISKNIAQGFFSSISKNEFILSGISLRMLGNSNDFAKFEEIENGDYYFLHVSYTSTFEKDICLNFSAYTPPREPVPLPADPVKEGHTFVGWYYDSAFTLPYDGQPIYEDTQLYAKFEIHKFTVTFNSDGGSSVANQTVNWNTAATLTTPTKAKHAFKGWFLPNGTQYTNQPIKANTTLTAHWERNVFTVTFNTDGGSAVESQDVNLNAAATLPTTTRTGYIFKGWYLSDGTKYENQPITSDLTLKAYWEVQTFTVTFYVDGELYETKTVEYGQGLVKVAETANLKILSVCMESGVPTFDDNGAVIVTENCSVEAQEMSDTDKSINTIKQNKWAIIGGVAGGVALIAVIAAVCGGKRKRKR